VGIKFQYSICGYQVFPTAFDGDCFFPIVCFQLLCGRLIGYRCFSVCLELLFWPIGLSVCFCYGLVVYFDVGYCDASSIGLFAQNCFVYSRSFVFPYIFQDWFFHFCLKYHCNFCKDCVEHVDCFCYTEHVDCLFSQCWFYRSMSLEGLSIIWFFLRFLSSVFYSFH
jgi:hypothetical protein